MESREARRNERIESNACKTLWLAHNGKTQLPLSFQRDLFPLFFYVIMIQTPRDTYVWIIRAIRKN
jgi:hypothetical protein